VPEVPLFFFISTILAHRDVFRQINFSWFDNRSTVWGQDKLRGSSLRNAPDYCCFLSATFKCSRKHHFHKICRQETNWHQIMYKVYEQN